MKLLVQRVKRAQVIAYENDDDKTGKVYGKINNGYVVFIGIKNGDTKKEADYLVNKLLNLRIFDDENDKLNLSILDKKGELLLISQFTLYGDASNGNRPSFVEAMNAADADILYDYFCKKCEEKIHVERGYFQHKMEVSLVNDGPTTIIIEKNAKKC